MKTIPIWVIFKRLPIELGDEGFSVVGSDIGIPLFTYTLTSRICVEIDTKCKFSNNVTMVVDNTKADNLPVEYNWRPPQCKHCDVSGHYDDKQGKVPKNN